MDTGDDLDARVGWLLAQVEGLPFVAVCDSLDIVAAAARRAVTARLTESEQVNRQPVKMGQQAESRLRQSGLRLHVEPWSEPLVAGRPAPIVAVLVLVITHVGTSDLPEVTVEQPSGVQEVLAPFPAGGQVRLPLQIGAQADQPVTLAWRTGTGLTNSINFHLT